MKELNLKVIGMHCEGCENRIKNALRQMEEIEEVIASYQNGTVRTKVKEEAELERIKETIEDLGFEIEEN